MLKFASGWVKLAAPRLCQAAFALPTIFEKSTEACFMSDSNTSGATLTALRAKPVSIGIDSCLWERAATSRANVTPMARPRRMDRLPERVAFALFAWLKKSSHIWLETTPLCRAPTNEMSFPQSAVAVHALTALEDERGRITDTKEGTCRRLGCGQNPPQVHIWCR